MQQDRRSEASETGRTALPSRKRNFQSNGVTAASKVAQEHANMMILQQLNHSTSEPGRGRGSQLTPALNSVRLRHSGLLLLRLEASGRRWMSCTHTTTSQSGIQLPQQHNHHASAASLSPSSCSPVASCRHITLILQQHHSNVKQPALSDTPAYVPMLCDLKLTAADDRRVL